MIPSQSVDLYSIYEDYPDLKSITIEGRHGGASYSLEELTENNFVITATEPRSAGFYLVQVEVPSLEVGKFNIIQFSYTF
ncbi:MAG: hypothetical protein HOJ35_00050 [Bdellovibrionales bacterium]|nr:hypothetical protein [Bdellovibrionales bacterium]